MKNLFVAYSDFINEDHDWIIFIDCGHGGIINGEYDTAPDKMHSHEDFTFYEGLYNRAIGLHLSGLLLQENISHAFTTDSNYDVSLRIRTTRVNNFVRKYPDKKFLSISIHGNAFKDSSVTGIETFSYSKNKKSDLYRNILHGNVSAMGWRDRGVKKANFHMLREVKCPSVLVELGFYTNLEESELMDKTETQERFAELLFNGIKEIIDGAKK